MLTKNKKSNQFKELSDKSKLEKPLTVCSCHVTYAFQSESTLKWLSVRLRTKWFWVRVQLQTLEKPI